jgi:hypothetical protein
MGLLGFDAILGFDLQYQILNSQLRIFAILSINLGILAILQFQPVSDFTSTRDPCDLGILAIWQFHPVRDKFSFTRADPCDFRDSCDFAISTG